jgi:glutamate---cysteine ligase / carboxylate-amine ligase
MRSFGVEEEFLLVNPTGGEAAAVGQEVYAVGRDQGLMKECKQEQIESATAPHLTLEDLADDIVACRAVADTAARATGARAVALATSPLPVRPQTTSGIRYQQMDDRFGLTSREQLTCGCHVHVSVNSDEEGVAVLDRARVWLPVLLALSANSPFWNGTDSGYASFRSQAWNRWPMAGPCEIFGSAARYHALVQELLECQVPLDLGQIYFDARLSRNHPTVEIRIGDVCLDPDDAVLQAALTRALVETAAREWQAGIPPLPAPAAKLRLAGWRASRFGVDAELHDPLQDRPRDAWTVVRGLLDHVRPVLEEQGETGLVESLIRQLMARGTGSHRQRGYFQRYGQLSDVVIECVNFSNLQRGPLLSRHEVAGAAMR